MMIEELLNMEKQTASELVVRWSIHSASEATTTDQHNGNGIYRAPAYAATTNASQQSNIVAKRELLKAKFDKLVKEWRENRPWGADITELSIQPAYQAIIGMGEKAIPYILRELRKKPDHWFWALNAIVADDSVDPIPEESQGKLREMAEAWVAWGEERGFI